MSTFTDCSDNLTCATLSGSNNINVNLQAGVPNKIVVSLSQSVVGLSNLEVTGTIKAKAIELSNSGGYSYLEIGAPVGAYIDLKNPESDDFDLRIISDSTPAGGGYLQAGGGAILSLSGSAVGIGTKSPAAELDVVGDGFINLDLRSAGAAGGTAGSYITVRRSGGTTASRTILTNGDYVGGYSFSGYDGSVYRPLASILGIVDGVPSSGDMPGSIAFSTTADGAPSETERMRIKPNGNVGIGTNNPNTKLHITGSQLLQGNLNNTSTRPAVAGGTLSANELRAASISSVSSNDGFMRISAGGGTDAIAKTFIDISGYSTIPDMDNNIAFGTSGVERIRIDNAGSVGIGTSTPSGKLTVEENSAGARWVINAKSNGINNDSGIYVNASNDMELALRNGGANLTTRIGSTGDSYISSSDNSNLGIGTKTPTSKLHVNGEITANGIIFGSTGGAVTGKTLDDYEEGTWTPTLQSNISAILSSVSGRYIRIGKVVHAFANFNIDSFNFGIGALTISGLPYACNSTVEGFAQNFYYYSTSMTVSSSLGTITLTTAPHGLVPTSATTVTLLKNGGASGDTSLLAADLTAAASPNASMKWYITYFTA